MKKLLLTAMFLASVGSVDAAAKKPNNAKARRLQKLYEQREQRRRERAFALDKVETEIHMLAGLTGDICLCAACDPDKASVAMDAACSAVLARVDHSRVEEAAAPAAACGTVGKPVVAAVDAHTQAVLDSNVETVRASKDAKRAAEAKEAWDRAMNSMSRDARLLASEHMSKYELVPAHGFFSSHYLGRGLTSEQPVERPRTASFFTTVSRELRAAYPQLKFSLLGR
jgi:hypothetical protein